MKTRRIIVISVLGIVALLLVRLAPLAWLFTSGLREPVAVPAPEYWPTDGWQSRTPEEMGFDSARLAEGLLELQANGSGIDSLLIIRNGYVVLDAHFAPYDGSFPHDLASVTKSVTTTLVAIATEQGYIDLDRTVISYFPDRTILNLDERKQQMTVRNLVESRNGMESGCYEGDEPTLDTMRARPDWVQAALDRPMVAEPGAEFCYDSPGFHILSAILQETTGMTELEFARQNLFEPLGIHAVVWETDPQGYTHGWGDLHLLPEDAAKFGYLFLHRGEWDGRQIVPQAWVLEAVRAHSRFVGNDYGYGYGWWVSPVDYCATGRGGQNVRVLASRDTLIVATGGGFEFPEAEEFLIPALVGLKDSRPANPEGEAALAAALAEISHDPSVTPTIASPDLARAVSGMTYLCKSNPANIENLNLDFDDPAQAVLSFRMGGVDTTWPIGLDWTYRFAQDGTAARGGWMDENMFQFVVFDIGVLTRQAIFNGNSIQLVLPEAGMTIACRAQNP